MRTLLCLMKRLRPAFFLLASCVAWSFGQEPASGDLLEELVLHYEAPLDQPAIVALAVFECRGREDCQKEKLKELGYDDCQLRPVLQPGGPGMLNLKTPGPAVQVGGGGEEYECVRDDDKGGRTGGTAYKSESENKAEKQGEKDSGKPPKSDQGELRWDEQRQRWVDDEWVYNWDARSHENRGGTPHWDRGPIRGGRGQWSPDGITWYPK